MACTRMCGMYGMYEYVWHPLCALAVRCNTTVLV
jgi:hypothetical protein